MLVELKKYVNKMLCFSIIFSVHAILFRLKLNSILNELKFFDFKYLRKLKEGPASEEILLSDKISIGVVGFISLAGRKLFLVPATND